MSAFFDALRAAFGDRARADVSLAPFTTFRIGGRAEWLVEPRSSDEIVTALRLADRSRVPVTMLGGGSGGGMDESGMIPGNAPSVKFGPLPPRSASAP